jgi:hypothetical protein
MFKMGAHDSFEYLKHKLWSKEGLKIALIHYCVGGVPHIKSSQRGLQLFFRPHFN